MLKMKITNAPKIKCLINLFREGIVDQQGKDTFLGIERDVIDGFFERAVHHYEDQTKKGDDAFIDRHLFFNAFQNRLSAYRTMQNRFLIVNQDSIFNKYFLIEEFEKVFERDEMKDISVISANFDEKNLQLLMSKGIYDDTAQVFNQPTQGVRRISSDINKLLNS